MKPDRESPVGLFLCSQFRKCRLGGGYSCGAIKPDSRYACGIILLAGGGGGNTERKVMIVDDVKLTAKQQRFCEEYLIDMNATQSAIRAGYSAKTARVIGQENLQKPAVKTYIEKRMAEKEAALIADQNEVMKYLTSVLRGKSQSEVVVVEGCGEGVSMARTMQKAPDEKERLKAAELLGRAHMLFTDKVQQDVDMELNITVDYGDGDDG